MAPEHDAHPQAFYDHETDEPSGRRRRAAADWGVGEDIFDRMPSRRFTRADRRAEHREEEPRRFERRVSGPAERDPAERGAVPRTIVIESGETSAARNVVLETGETDALLEAGPPARRTVIIKGQPDRLPIQRTQRPPRTAVERIGTSPDRIVAYAVALGFLLVLIAVLTTGQ
jgi:hypothetical protein